MKDELKNGVFFNSMNEFVLKIKKAEALKPQPSLKPIN
jgi:hypothetical protein